MNAESSLDTPPSNGLDPILAALLIAAAEAEANVTGSGRRKQFRLTRRLLAGMRKNGASVSEIADLLGRTANSIRDRSNEDGGISASDFSALAGVPVSQIVGWEAAGHLPSPVTEWDGYVGYPTTVLLQAFVVLSRA